MSLLTGFAACLSVLAGLTTDWAVIKRAFQYDNIDSVVGVAGMNLASAMLAPAFASITFTIVASAAALTKGHAMGTLLAVGSSGVILVASSAWTHLLLLKALVGLDSTRRNWFVLCATNATGLCLKVILPVVLLRGNAWQH